MRFGLIAQPSESSDRAAQMNEPTQRWWTNRSNIALAVFVAIGGYFLWTEHRAHVIEFLPWLLVLGCCAMHFFMHRGHRHDGHGSDNGARSRGEGKRGADR
jgi:hypothetical protein